MAERFKRHRQPWNSDNPEASHPHQEGHGLKAIAKALTRTEVSVKERAKLDKVPIASCAEVVCVDG